MALTWEIAQLRCKLELDLRGLSSFVFWDRPTLLWLRRSLLKSAWFLCWMWKISPQVYRFWPFELPKKQNVKLCWIDAAKPVLKQTSYLKILVHLTLKKAYASLPRWGIHRDHCCWSCTDLHKLKVWHQLSTPSQSLKSMGDEKPSLDGNGDFITPGGCRKILCSASQIKVMGLHMAPACHGESLMSK